MSVPSKVDQGVAGVISFRSSGSCMNSWLVYKGFMFLNRPQTLMLSFFTCLDSSSSYFVLITSLTLRELSLLNHLHPRAMFMNPLVDSLLGSYSFIIKVLLLKDNFGMLSFNI
jgi:hypothetical protein